MSGPVGPVGFGAPRDVEATSRVRRLMRQVVAETLGPEAADDLTILVTELACTEPGCPPRETVVALMHPGAPIKHTLHRPAAEVDLADLRALSLVGPDAERP